MSDRRTSPAGAAERRCLRGLNEPQREAVEHFEGPLLILAGAGSGKTRVLAHRVAYLIKVRRVRPDEVLAITFTNKAAGEMRARIGSLVGPMVRVMWISTFHSMCARILRREAERLGYKSTFSIYDADDAKRLVKRCLAELDLDDKRFTPDAVARAISDAKNRLLDPAAFRRADRRLLSARRRRRLRALREEAHGDERHGLRRPADEDGQPARDLSRTGSSTTSARSASSWSTNTRTRTTPSTASPTCWPASAATSPWSATTTSRSTRGAAPTSATSSSSSATTPTPR